MGTGADYTEFVINSGGTISIVSPTIVIASGYITGPEMGHFAIDVHEIGSVPVIGPIEVTNINGYCMCVTPIGDQGFSFSQASDGSLFVTGPIEIVNISGDYIDVNVIAPIEIVNISGQFIDVNIIAPVEITNTSGHCICTTPVGDQGLSFSQDPNGNLFVIDPDLEAIGKVVVHDVSQPAANTNIFVNDIIPSFPPADFRVQVIMSNSGNFSVAITHSGNTQIGLLNVNSPAGVTLMAGALYTFDILVHKGDSINFQYDNTGGTIQTLRLQEIDASAY